MNNLTEPNEIDGLTLKVLEQLQQKIREFLAEYIGEVIIGITTPDTIEKERSQNEQLSERET